MLTDKEALEKAKEELSRAIYLFECSRSAGIRAINEDKAEWLSVLIYLAEREMKGGATDTNVGGKDINVLCKTEKGGDQG